MTETPKTPEELAAFFDACAVPCERQIVGAGSSDDWYYTGRAKALRYAAEILRKTPIKLPTGNAP